MPKWKSFTDDLLTGQLVGRNESRAADLSEKLIIIPQVRRPMYGPGAQETWFTLRPYDFFF